jgi:hypothetical protein
MVTNMGTADRAVRILLAIVVAILYVMGKVSGTAAVILGLIAVVFVVTSAMGFCPAYLPFKINTGGKK